MLGSWESQATDPRRPRYDDPEAKRRHLEPDPATPPAWLGFASGAACGCGPGGWAPPPPVPAALGPSGGYWNGAPAWPGGPPGPPQPPQPPQLWAPQAAPAFGCEMTAQIVNALRHHMSGPGSGPPGHPVGGYPGSQPGGPGSYPGTGPELSTRLVDSLRTLLPAGGCAAACGSSMVGQELFRVVQNFAPQQMQAQANLMQVKVEADCEAAPVAAEFLQPMGFAFTTLPPQRVPREEDIESDEDVPHRLPPGFGAIPEDIIEERARLREEERVLRLKATQPCRFGRRCKRRDCPNAHPEGRDIDTNLNPCAFGRRCKRKGCFYDHPEGRLIDDDPTKGMCKFLARCSRPDCLYDHPEGRVALAGPDPRICYFCHDSGHIATDCPRNSESWNFNREADREKQMAPTLELKAITAG